MAYISLFAKSKDRSLIAEHKLQQMCFENISEKNSQKGKVLFFKDLNVYTCIKKNKQ